MRIIFKKTILSALLCCTLLLSANSMLAYAATINDVSIEKPSYGLIRTESGSLNIRQSPSTTSDIVASLPRATYVMIVGQSGNFYKVQYDTNGHYGYASKDYVSFMGGDHGYYIKVNNISGNLNMRSSADTSGNILASIPANTSLAYRMTIGTNWHLGVYGNAVGHVNAGYVTLLQY